MKYFDKSPFYFYDKLVKCPRHLKTVFISSFIFGCISHMYIMLNISPQGDVCSAFFGYGAGYTSGRWGLSLLGNFIGRLFGNYSLPWLNGILSILFLATASVFIVKSFDVYNEVNCIFIGAIMVIFPSITSAFTFIFTVQYYCFSILLTCAAVYFVRKYPKGWIAGVILLAFSLGIYQAYLGVAAGFFLLFLIVDMLQSKHTVMRIFADAWKYLGVIVASVFLYFICNKIALMITHNQLSEYMGINSMGQLPLNELQKILSRIYIEFFAPMLADRNGITQYPILRFSYLIFLLFTLYFGIRIICFVQVKRGFAAMCLVGFFLILFPFAINIIYMMCFYWVHTLMRYAMVVFYIAVIIIWEQNKQLFFSVKWIPGVEWVITCLCMITVGSFCIQANEASLCLNQRYRQAYSYYTTVIAQIKMTEGYKADTPIAFIGEVQDSTFPVIKEFDNLENLTGIPNAYHYINMYSRNKFIEYFCGFQFPVADDIDKIKHLPQFQIMPFYPDYGSIRMIDETLVIKFGD